MVGLNLVADAERQVLHQSFRRSHDVDRAGCLVGRNTEEVAGRLSQQDGEQRFRFRNVIVHEIGGGNHVLFAAHVFECREVGHDVKRTFALDHLQRQRMAEIHWIGREDLGHFQV